MATGLFSLKIPGPGWPPFAVAGSWESFVTLGPYHRDDVVKALGDKIRVQEVSITTAGTVVFNCEKKPFDDPRVRRALSLALDRWEGEKQLYRISNMKEVGGLLRPGSEYSMSEAELVRTTGYSKDIDASRREARRLLREAGVPDGFSFELSNRPPPRTMKRGPSGLSTSGGRSG